VKWSDGNPEASNHSHRGSPAAGRCYLFFFGGAWVNADAATLLTAFGVLGLLRSFDALLATLFDVVSFLPTVIYLSKSDLRSIRESPSQATASISAKSSVKSKII
jgi:hypothetical protein